MSVEPTSVSDIRYKCPVCFKALFPPVLQCQNGHLLCESCLVQLKNCPVCRISLLEIGRVRNLEVEKIIQIIQHPCPNEDDGCDAILKFEEMEDHRLECRYTKHPICKNILGIDCGAIRVTDYIEHSERVHRRKFVDLRRKTLPVIYRTKSMFFKRGDFCSLRFHFLFEEKPTLVMVIARHIIKSDLMMWTPYVLAGTAVTNQLCCKVSFLSGENVKFMSESPIFNLQTKPADLETSLSVPFKYLQTMFGMPSVNDKETGEFRYCVEISKKVAAPLNEPANSEEIWAWRGN